MTLKVEELSVPEWFNAEDYVDNTLKSDAINNRIDALDRRGIIRNELIDGLIKIHDESIKEFYDYTKLYSTPYDSEYFNADEEAETIQKIMDIAKPKMTNDYVI